MSTEAHETGRARAAIGVALALVVGAALRFACLGADPWLSLSSSNSEVQDGPWYLAQAIDSVRGKALGVSSSYTKPVFTALSRATFEARGVSLESAHVMEAALGTLLVALGALAARRAFGSRTGLAVGLLLAVSFPLVGYARAPLVYGPLATAGALVACLFVEGARAPRLPVALAWHAAAWAVLGGATIGLKQSALVLAPALALGQLAAARRPWRAGGALAGMFALAAVSLSLRGSAAIDEMMGKIPFYLSLDGLPLAAVPETILKRLLNAPAKSGLAFTAPGLLVLGWSGALAAVAPRRASSPEDARGERAFELFLAVWFASVFLANGALAYTDPPARHFVGALVPAAILGARLLALVSGDGLALRVPRWLLLLWALPLAYAGISVALTCSYGALSSVVDGATLDRLVGFRSIALVSSIVAAAVAWRAGRPCVWRLSRRSALGALCLVIAIDGAHLTAALPSSTTSLRDANRLCASLFGQGAVVAGPFAHMLTYDADVRRVHYNEIHVLDPEGVRALRERPPGRLEPGFVSAHADRAGLDEPRRLGFTHFVVDADKGEVLEVAYAAIGQPLVHLATVSVRGFPIAIVRFAWAEDLGYRPTAAERAR